jgi:hypothetical protein
VSWVDGQAFRLRAERPMMISPREVLRPIALGPARPTPAAPSPGPRGPVDRWSHGRS